MSQVIQERLSEIQTLKTGAHRDQSAMCVMEAVAYVAGEPWSDSPKCACPVISGFLRRWNDGIRDDETRTRLLAPLVPRLVGSKSTPEVELKRAYLAVDWVIRVSTPVWLGLAGLSERATLLRELAEITDANLANAARELASKAREAAREKRDEARRKYAAAAAAAYAAAAAAYAAADAAYAYAAAYADGGVDAYAAYAAVADDAAAADAYAAAAYADAYAAYDAAAAAAADADAAAAADAAAYAAYAAADAAADAAAADDAAAAAADAAAADADAAAALKPTVEQMQASALGLVDRMLAVGGEA